MNTTPKQTEWTPAEHAQLKGWAIKLAIVDVAIFGVGALLTGLTGNWIWLTGAMLVATAAAFFLLVLPMLKLLNEKQKAAKAKSSVD